MTKYTALRKTRKNRVIVCEDLDFVWDEPELVELAELWNAGASVESMAEHFGREDPDEVLMAIIHIARADMIATRKNGLKGES